MGWLGPVVNGVEHEGYVVPFFPDGEEGAGSYSSRGIQVGEYDEDRWRPDADVAGHRAGCACGWRGRDWTDWPGVAFLESDDEDALMVEWRAHIRPSMALERAAEVVDTWRKAAAELDESIRDARTAGATWAEVGRAVGMSRQAAWERWHRPDEARLDPFADWPSTR